MLLPSTTAAPVRTSILVKIYIVIQFKVTVQFKTEGNGQNEIVSHMDRSEVKL